MVEEKLGTQNLIDFLYFNDFNETIWSQFDMIHLLINHRYYLDANSTIKEFDEINIWKYNYTYGNIARSVLTKARMFIPDYDY